MPWGHGCHPPLRLSLQLSLPWPRSQGFWAPRGSQVMCQGLWELQAYSSWSWQGVAQPHLQLGFPPLSLWADLAGPHRLLGSLCLINGAGAVCGAYGRNAWCLWPRATAAPPPPLATAPPASGNQSQPRAGLGSGELRPAGPSPPNPGLPSQNTPDDKRLFSFPSTPPPFPS